MLFSFIAYMQYYLLLLCTFITDFFCLVDGSQFYILQSFNGLQDLKTNDI